MGITKNDQEWGRDHDIPVAPHSFRHWYWQELTVGDRVVVEIMSGHPISGHVDAITEDRSVLWVQFTEGQGRRLFHRQDSVVLKRAPPGLIDAAPA